MSNILRHFRPAVLPLSMRINFSIVQVVSSRSSLLRDNFGSSGLKSNNTDIGILINFRQCVTTFHRLRVLIGRPQNKDKAYRSRWNAIKDTAWSIQLTRTLGMVAGGSHIACTDTFLGLQKYLCFRLVSAKKLWGGGLLYCFLTFDQLFCIQIP